MTRQQSGSGRYLAGEKDVLILPNRRMSFTNVGHLSRRPVVFLHGGGGNAHHGNYPNDSNAVGQPKIIKTIAEAGYPVMSIDAGNPPEWKWGNADVLAAVSAAKTYMQGTLGARSGPVHIVGTSMGGLGGLNWAASNPTLVACVIGVLPVIDINYVHANNIGSQTANINTAYGTYNNTTMRGTYNPAYMASTAGGSKFDTINLQVWRATDDIYTPEATYATFDTDADLCELRSLGALGHTDEAMAQIVFPDLVTFLKAND